MPSALEWREFSSPFEQIGLTYMANTTNSCNTPAFAKFGSHQASKDSVGEKNHDREGREMPV